MSTPTKRRQLVKLWIIGLILTTIAISVDTKWQVWNTPSRSIVLYILALGTGVLGLIGYGIPSIQFQKWPQAKFTAYGKNKGLDERDIQQLLEAQAKAQRSIINGLIVVNILVLIGLNKGLNLSWWSCLLLLNGLVSLMCYLPTAILAWSESDLDDDLEK